MPNPNLLYNQTTEMQAHLHSEIGNDDEDSDNTLNRIEQFPVHTTAL